MRPSSTFIGPAERALAFAFVSAVAACCASAPAQASTLAGFDAPAPAWRGPPADSIAEAVARVIGGVPPVDGYPSHRWAHVRRLYARRNGVPLWLDGGRVAERAATVVDAIADAPREGLRADAYPLVALRTALEAVASQATAARVATADVVLTASFVAYAEDMLTGQLDPHSINPAWHIDPKEVDVDSALARTMDHASMRAALALLRPQDADYTMLIGDLARYRAIVAAGGWSRVGDLPVLRPGDTVSAGALGSLRARLRAEGYAAPAEDDRARVVYDRAIAAAVADYQRHHDLAVDSIVGPSTRASLDQPAEFRLRQIAANLERHRWMPRDRGDRYLLVNVAAFRLRAYDGGRPVLTMNVVVGAEYGGRSTPVFSDSMAYVVFRPYWNVPDGIAARELWPEQRSDPGYFRRNGYETVRASWGTYVRQRPGPGNALGFVKFIFPNDYSIYLHDTPARHLFAERVRAFSHGCIRVEHPDELARFVLGPQGWDLARVQRAMDKGNDDVRVNLDRKLPVYIAYFTTYRRDGSLHFASDIYDRDDALVRAVTGAALPTADQTAAGNGLREAVLRAASGR